MEGHKLDGNETNREVLSMVDERRELLNTKDARHGKKDWTIIRHDSFFKTILDENIEGKTGKGSPWRSYVDQGRSQVKETDVPSNQEVKQLAHERDKWMLLTKTRM